MFSPLRSWLFLGGCLSLTAAILAEDKPIAATPIVQLTLHPAAEPVPALRYRLLPTERQCKPGNGAVFFYRAIHAAYRHDDSRKAMKEFEENHTKWQAEIADPKIREAIKTCLAGVSKQTFHDLREAAFRDEAKFDFRLHEATGMDAISFLLGELQDARNVARVLALKARLAAWEGRPEEAIETLLIQFRLAEIVGTEPLLINRLVGIAIGSMACAELEQLVSQPNTPNLYWSLAAIPQPLIGMRDAVEFEAGLPEQYFPFLKDAEHATRSPEEWKRLLFDAAKSIHELQQGVSEPDPNTDWTAMPPDKAEAELNALLKDVYPVTKQLLLQSGLPPAAVEKMSEAQVVAIRMSHVTKRCAAEMSKVLYATPQDYEAISKKFEHDLKMAKHEMFATSIVASLLPAVQRVYMAQLRSQREFAALQTLEALRMHLAAEGQLPKSLGEIKVVPVPLNPFTHEAFPYHLQGEGAVLELAPYEAANAATGKRYEISRGKQP